MMLGALVLGSMLLFSEVSAQTVGLRAGVNWHNLTGKDNNGYEFTNSLVPRLHAGVNLSIPVATDFVVRPELMYAEKGAKSPAGNDYKLTYLEVPVNLIYQPTMGKGRLMVGFRPYVGLGLGGKVEFTNGVTHDVKYAENVVNPESNTAYYRKTDAGVNVLAGYDFGRMSLQANAQLGLMNIYPEFDGVQTNASLKNTGVGLSLGVKL